MKQIRKILLAILIVINVIMITSTIVVYLRDGDSEFIVICGIVNISSAISILPFYYTKY